MSRAVSISAKAAPIIEKSRYVAVTLTLGATGRSAAVARVTNPRWLISKFKTITPQRTMRGYAALARGKCNMFIDYEGRAFAAGIATGFILGICLSLLAWAMII